MKYLALSIFSLLVLNTTMAQKITPKIVEDAFTQLYSTVETPFWEYREEAFVAMFLDEDGLKKVFFKEDGEWLETRIRMDLQDLPTGVLSFVDQHYKDADITYAGKVERSDGWLYRVESELTTAIIIKLLNEQGDLLEEQRIGINNPDAVEIISYPLPVRTIKPIAVEKL